MVIGSEGSADVADLKAHCESQYRSLTSELTAGKQIPYYIGKLTRAHRPGERAMCAGKVRETSYL